MIEWSICLLSNRMVKTTCLPIKTLRKNIDETHRIVCTDVLIHRFGKHNLLVAAHTLYVARASLMERIVLLLVVLNP